MEQEFMQVNSLPWIKKLYYLVSVKKNFMPNRALPQGGIPFDFDRFIVVSPVFPSESDLLKIAEVRNADTQEVESYEVHAVSMINRLSFPKNIAEYKLAEYETDGDQ